MYERKTKECVRSWTFQHKFWYLCLFLWCLLGFITIPYYTPFPHSTSVRTKNSIRTRWGSHFDIFAVFLSTLTSIRCHCSLECGTGLLTMTYLWREPYTAKKIIFFSAYAAIEQRFIFQALLDEVIKTIENWKWIVLACRIGLSIIK